MICMWQWITVIKEGTYSFVQSLKCFEKVNNYDIEYKLQSRMLYHQVTSYYARGKKCLNKYRISANSFLGSYSFLNLLKSWKFCIVSSSIFLLYNENLNSFLTRVRKVFKGGKYSREETIRGNTVHFILCLR